MEEDKFSNTDGRRGKRSDDFTGTVSIAFKLSLNATADTFIVNKLETILKENGLNIDKNIANDDASTCFLLISRKVETSGSNENDVIKSRGSDIRDLYEDIFDMKCTDCEIYGYKAENSFVSQMRKKKLVKDIFAIHSKDDRRVLMRSWVLNILGKQPIHAIEQYFGPEIAAYFSWMGFYTISLLFPCLVGLTQLVFDDASQSSRISYVSLAGVIMNILWAAFFLVAWNYLGNSNHIFSAKKNESYFKVRRTQFSPRNKVNQRVKQLISVLVTVFVLLLVIATSYTILELDSTTKKSLKYDKEFSGTPKFVIKILNIIPQILLSLSMIGFNFLYSNMAEKLTQWENYKYTSSYNNALLAKLIAFRLFNAFHTLIHITFVMEDLDLLHIRLVNLLIVQQIRTNVGEVLGPDLRVKLLQVLVSLVVCSFLSDGYVVSVDKLLGACGVTVGVYIGKMVFFRDVKIPKFIKNVLFQQIKKKRHLTLVEKESEMRQYDSTFLDYLEMLIQFGYVFLFSPVYWLGCTFALVNNLVEIHTDAFRIVKLSKRPFPSFKSTHTIWWYAFAIMTLCGIITNSHIIGNFSVFKELPIRQIIIFFGLIFVFAYVGIKSIFKRYVKNLDINKKQS